MTRNEIIRRYPNASEGFIRANLSAPCDSGDPGLRPKEPEHNPGKSLVKTAQGKGKDRRLPGTRTFVVFLVHSRRPQDFDNNFTKPLQDLLREIGLLESDDWDRLQGRVVPIKVETQEEEGTVVQIWYE